MKNYLGIDTSNYKTSAALCCDDGTFRSGGMLISVPDGAVGIRQSEAVFLHLKQLPGVITELAKELVDIGAVGVSVKPRDEEGSYMPCFTAGESTARCVAAVLKVPLYCFSHQAGHVMAGVVGSNSRELLSQEFLAWHVSGGTTELLHVKPHSEKIFDIERAAYSLDLKAGQAIDRVGVMLGLPFPCGPKLEKLAKKSNRKFKIHPVLKDGNCCLSGVENQCANMLSKGENAPDVAKYCLDFVAVTLDEMTKQAYQRFSGLPLLCAGGVMSNGMIREKFEAKYSAVFAPPELSSDNAVGIAALTKIKAEQNGR